MFSSECLAADGTAVAVWCLIFGCLTVSSGPQPTSSTTISSSLSQRVCESSDREISTTEAEVQEKIENLFLRQRIMNFCKRMSM